MSTSDSHALAHRYAPVFAQKVMREWPVADQIAPADLAVPGDLTQLADNPDALHALPENALIPAKVYYSVCETTTHYFLVYAVYHVLDWWKRYEPNNLYDFVRDQLDEHVHDMEGALVVVTKEPRGLIDAVVTVSHNNFYLHTIPMRPFGVGQARRAYQGSLEVVKFNETVDGKIWLDQATGRVKLYIQARGHGLRGDHSDWGGGDEIWYYGPEGEAAEAGTLDPGERRTTRACTYELVDLFTAGGLWAHRFHRRVFRQLQSGRWGFVYTDENGKRRGGAANPPWSWNDHNDTSPIGEMATDPATFILRYGQGWGPVSKHYVVNPYQRIAVGD